MGCGRQIAGFVDRLGCYRWLHLIKFCYNFNALRFLNLHLMLVTLKSALSARFFSESIKSVNCRQYLQQRLRNYTTDKAVNLSIKCLLVIQKQSSVNLIS